MTTLCRLLWLLTAAVISCTAAETLVTEPQRFVCPGEGFFPVPGSCREYYDCFVFRGSLYLRPSRCPTGWIFEEEVSACTLASHPFVCRASAQKVITTVAPKMEALRGNENTFVSVDSTPSENINPTDEIANINQVLDLSTVSDAAENSSAVYEDSLRDIEGLNITFTNGTTTDQADTLEDVKTLNISLSNGTTIDSTDALGDVEDLNITLSNVATTNATTTTTQPPIILTLCDHMNFVTSYTTLLIGTPFQKQSVDYQITFNTLAKRYNTILEMAQNNSLVWKNGDSIFGRLKKAFKVANAYEREFNRKYDICQERITKQTNNEAVTAKLQGDIKKLEEEIMGTEQALSVTNVPQVRQYFENSIKSKRQEIERKQEEIALSTRAALQLGEILQFLEYTKTDANEVENLAKHLQTRIRTLSNIYARDFSTLQNFMNRVNTSIQSFTEEEESTNSQSADNTDRQQTLELRKANLNEETNTINTALSTNMKSVRRLQREMDTKRDIFNRKVASVCDPSGPIKLKLRRFATKREKEEACNELLEAHNIRLNINNELAKVEDLLKQNERNRNRITEIMAEIDHANQELAQLLGEEPIHETRLQEIRSEVEDLQLLHTDLLALTTAGNAAMESLSVIDETIQEVHNSFESLTKQFSIMITQGQSAKTDEDRLQEKAVIEQHISELVQTIQRLDLPDLEQCE